MTKIKFQKDIGIDALYLLITSHLLHGFHYTVISRKTFTLLAENDKSLNIEDKRNQGIGYIWYSYDNFIYLIVDEYINENELIYLKEEDVNLLVRKRKIEYLKSKII